MPRNRITRSHHPLRTSGLYLLTVVGCQGSTRGRGGGGGGIGNGSCGSATAACLTGDRFQVSVSFTANGTTADATAIRMTTDTGYFWFFDPTNVELVVKVLDGRSINDHFWVFYGALSNTQYTVTVRRHRDGPGSALYESGGSTGFGRRHGRLLDRAGLLRPRGRRFDTGGPLPSTGFWHRRCTFRECEAHASRKEAECDARDSCSLRSSPQRCRCSESRRAAHAAVAVSVSVFHDHLAPYGRWVAAGSYGNVWVPRVAAGWAPYVDGEWAYTDYGWTWVSYDPWGGDPCHYGSWAWVDPYGWVWTPGTVWAPAWVTWAYTDDYVGWAPIPPTFALSVTGYAGSPVVLATTRYCFVPSRQFVGVRVASVRVPVERNAAIFSSAVKTTNFRVSGGVVRAAGPPTAKIEKVTRAQDRARVDRSREDSSDDARCRRACGRVRASPSRRRRPSGSTLRPRSPRRRRRQVGGEGDRVAKSEKAHAEAPKSVAAKPVPSHPAPHAEEKTTTAEHHEAKPPAKPKAKPAPEKHEEVAKKSAPKPVSKAPRRPRWRRRASPNPAPRKEPQAEPPAENRPTEETRVASHETRHAPAHTQKPAPKPKAPPEPHPQPPKEEKPGQ